MNPVARRGERLGKQAKLTTMFNVNANYRYILNERDNLNGEASGVTRRVLLKLQ